MKETELRIQKYKAMLPRARERVIAALMIFVFSIAMLTVSTFSWITLSVAPEVTGATTTIAANGNLEIALAGRYDSAGNLLEPAATAIGDGTLPVTERNITWGNLVNLSDPSYALDKIVLRPASLNKSALLTAPLYAAKYNAYGQVYDYDDDFALTAWDGNSGFEQSETRGINAISSVRYETVEYDDPDLKVYEELSESAKGKLRLAASEFNELSSKMSPVAGLISTFMNGTLKSDATNEACTPSDIIAFGELMEYLYDKPMQTLGESLMDIFYMYQLGTSKLKNESGESVYQNYERFTDLERFCDGALTELTKINAARALSTDAKDESFIKNITTANLSTNATFQNVIFKTIKQYISDRNTLEGYITQFTKEGGIYEQARAAASGSGSVTWGEISGIVNGLVDINSCTIGGYTVNQLSSTHMKQAISMVLSGDTQKAVIGQGLVARVEAMLHGSDCIKVKITVGISKKALSERVKGTSYESMWNAGQFLLSDPVKVSAEITTSAATDYPTATGYLDIEKANAIVGTPLKASKYFAQDTYGLSVDFWLRTNAPSTYLVLEGEVVYDNQPITAVVDIGGTRETVEVYTVPVKKIVVTKGVEANAEAETIENIFPEQEVYQKDGVWYYISNSQPVVVSNQVEELKDADGNTYATVTTNAEMQAAPEQKLSKNVIGYNGVNRIWNDETYLGNTYNVDYSTSQGVGSCYTFYAKDPSDVEKCLDLLSALRVVFHDSDGNYLATAVLATDLYYSEYGEITVPLVILEESTTLYATVKGENDTKAITVPAITNLYKGDAELITALVYLDGEIVENDQVLASSEIQGKLNIQFGSTYVPSDAMKDDSLRDEEVRVTGEIVGGNAFTYSPGSTHSTKIKIAIDGATPSGVTGHLVRAINNVQGTLYKTVTFNQTSEEGVWEATVVFDAPGTFIMRSVFIDGIEYAFERTSEDDKVKVVVEGVALTKFSSNKGYGTTASFVTADSSVSETFMLELGSSDYIPSKITGSFVNEDNIYVTVIFKSVGSNGTQWQGTADFTYPGTYKLKNISIDGSYYALPNNAVYTRIVSTGLRANVNIKIADEYSDNEVLTIAENGVAYLFRGYSHEFDIAASIVDSYGNGLGYVGDRIRVSYTNNLSADLYWNGEEYIGNFLVETPGEFKFSDVYLNMYAQSITSASEADSITCIPTDPVEYLGITESIPEKVITVGDAEEGNIITMRFKNAQASTLYGLFEVTDGNGNKNYTVLAANRTTVGAESENTNDFTFNITQDGYWKLIDTKLSLVYDDKTEIFYLGDGMLSAESANVVLKTKDGDAEVEVVNVIGAQGYDSEKVLSAFNAAGNYYEVEENLPGDYTNTKVIAKFNVTHNLGASGGVDTDYGNDTDVFMTSYTLNGIKVSVFDFEGKAVTETVNWTMYKALGSTLQYGGYTYDNDNDTTPVEYTLTTSDGVNYTFSPTLTIAGRYVSEVMFEVNGVQHSIEVADIIIDTATPSVAVTAVSNQDTKITTTITYKENNSSLDYTFGGEQTNTISNSDKIEVWAYAESGDSNLIGGNSDAGFVCPELTFTASGISNSTTVKFDIPKGEAAKSVTVTLTGTSAGKSKLGVTEKHVSKTFDVCGVGLTTFDLYKYRGHGTQTISNIRLTYGGVDYTVTLDKPIVIHNPSSTPTGS